MPGQTEIHIFTKPRCPYCIRAKELLTKLGLEFVVHDVQESPAMAAASMYLSGRTSVPQIFFGDQHINGATDLEALHAAGLLLPLLENSSGELALDPSLEQQWRESVEDFSLTTVLDKVDLTKKMDDPEICVILNVYKQLFGFTPISYMYMAGWTEAVKSCALSNVIATMPVLMQTVGSQLFGAITYTASNAQGCNYCTVHAATRKGADQPSEIKQLQLARSGTPGPGNPFTPLNVAMVELAEMATLNTVTDEQVAKVTRLAKEASKDPKPLIEGVALCAEMMSFLNTFNDLVNVEIEGGLANEAATELGIEGGRHAASDTNPNDLDFDLPVPTMTTEAVLGARAQKASDWQGLAKTHLGYVPGWLAAWPDAMKPFFAGMYTELMASSEVDAELKQLMARVSAIVKGHAAVAASTAISAHHMAKDKTKAIQRISQCFAVASGQAKDTTLFTRKERLALRYAWLSAQTPILTPTQFLKPMVTEFSQREILELTVACGMACAVQRMTAALQTPMSPEEDSFCTDHGIETDIWKARYPRSTKAAP